MAKQTINVGTASDDGTGDTLRAAFVKVNTNFTELYNEIGGDVLSDLKLTSNKITTDNTNANIILDPNGTGKVEVDGDSLFRGSTTATGQIRGATLQVDGNANIDGNLTVDGALIAGSFSVGTLSGTNQTLTGNLIVQGNTDLGDTSADTVTVTGRFDSSLVPSVTQTNDLGGSSLRWRDLYARDIDARNGIFSGTLSVTGQADLGQLRITGNKIESDVTNADITLDANGTGTINVSANKITNVTDPTAAQDAATKAYVDATVSATNELVEDTSPQLGGNLDLNSRNITGTGNINITGNVTATNLSGTFTGSTDFDTITTDGLTIVDNNISANRSNDGLILSPSGTGSINLNGTVIGTGVLDEDNMASNSAVHLATQQSIKAYVDATVSATNEVVEDTTPQLGGDLDLNSNDITGTGDINITGTITATTINVGGGTLDVDALTTDGLRIVDNNIQGTRSNENIILIPNGTGQIEARGQILATNNIKLDSNSDLITNGNRITHASSGTVSFLDFTKALFSQTNHTVLSSVKSINFFLDSNGGDAGQAFRIYNNQNPDGSVTENTHIFKVAEDGVVSVSSTIDLNGTTLTGGSNNLTISGTFDADTITTDGISITDNNISSNRSNDDLILSPSGTGSININGTVKGTGVLDEDNMASDSASHLATQQSIKAYADTKLANVVEDTTPQLGGNLDPNGNNIVGTGDFEIDVSGSILLDADSGTIFFQDGTAGTFGQVIRNGSNDLTIASGSTQALIFTGANAAFQNNISVAGTLNTHTIPGGTGTLALTSTAQGAIPTAGNTGTGSIGVGDTLQALGTTNEINVDAAGSALSFSLADNISGVTSITVSGSLNTDGILIVDNSISSDRSNDDLTLDANGTGQIVFRAPIQINEGIEEKFETVTGASGVTALDCSKGHIFYKTGCTGDITANFTNLTLSQEYATNLTVIINQGGTPYEITAVQIGGAGQTLNWQGGSAPTGNANGIDAFSFTILNDGGSYVVLGQMVDFT